MSNNTETKIDNQTFSGLIKCGICGSNFKKKMQRKVLSYICSKYDREGLKSNCKRIVIKHEQLMFIIQQHYKFTNVSESNHIDMVDKILIDTGKITVKYKDNSPDSIITSTDSVF